MRTKFGSSERGFRIRAARKMGREQKGGRSPSPSTSLLSPHFCEKTPSRGPNFVRVVRERLLRRLCTVMMVDSFSHCKEENIKDQCSLFSSYLWNSDYCFCFNFIFMIYLSSREQSCVFENDSAGRIFISYLFLFKTIPSLFWFYQLSW